jgi:hypothetical protein
MKTPKTFFDDLCQRIDIAHAVRTRSHAIPASDAPVRIDINDPVRALDRGFDRTHGHADWFCAVIADNGKGIFFGMRIGSFFHPLYPTPPDAEWNIVFTFADHSAGIASDTFAQIDQHGVAFFIHFHDFPAMTQFSTQFSFGI